MEAQLIGSDLLKEGWLTKEAVGKSGSWRKRYFVFRNNGVGAVSSRTRTKLTCAPAALLL
jgi:hypothetical protein